jgi:hypothetical protein
MEAAMTQEDTNLILETMNDKFQQMLDCFSLHSKEILISTKIQKSVAMPQFSFLFGLKHIPA